MSSLCTVINQIYALPFGLSPCPYFKGISLLSALYTLHHIFYSLLSVSHFLLKYIYCMNCCIAYSWTTHNIFVFLQNIDCLLSAVFLVPFLWPHISLSSTHRVAAACCYLPDLALCWAPAFNIEFVSRCTLYMCLQTNSYTLASGIEYRGSKIWWRTYCKIPTVDFEISTRYRLLG